MINKKDYIEKLILKFLEDAPTLDGLPVEFLPSDIFYNKGVLDFTLSENISTYVQDIYADLDQQKVEDLFEKYDTVELTNYLLNDSILFSYYKTVHSDVYLEAKEKCSKLLINVVNKYNHDFELDNENRALFLSKYKLKNNLYPRGLKDYDYELFGVELTKQNFRKSLQENVKEAFEQFIVENNVSVNKTYKQGVTTQSTLNINNMIKKDVENIGTELSKRVLKIIRNNKVFYTEQIKQMNVVGQINLPMKQKNIPLPIIKTVNKDKTFEMYNTPFSCYIQNSKGEYFTVYHIGRNTLEECLKNMQQVIKKYHFTNQPLTYVKLLPLRRK